MTEKDEELMRRCVNLSKGTYEIMDSLLEISDSKNRNDFIEKAVRFYIGFLNTRKAEAYLLTTFQAAISGTIGGAEERISRLLYKNCVELAMLNRILAYSTDVSEELLEQIYAEADEEVSSTIGYWEHIAKRGE